jgi:hypothetical protein
VDTRARSPLRELVVGVSRRARLHASRLHDSWYSTSSATTSQRSASIRRRIPPQESSFSGDTLRHAMPIVRASCLHTAMTSLVLSLATACQGSRESSVDSRVAKARADSVRRANAVVPDGYVRIFTGEIAQADILMVFCRYRAVAVEPESEKTSPWTIVRVPARRSGPALDSMPRSYAANPASSGRIQMSWWTRRIHDGVGSSQRAARGARFFPAL